MKKIKWLVFLTSRSGSAFEADTVDSTWCIASFDEEDEALTFIRQYEFNSFTLNLFIVKGVE